MTTGWTLATIVNDWNDRFKGFDAAVRSDCRTPTSLTTNPRTTFLEGNREHVMRMDETQAPVEISVFVVCWWTYWNAKTRMLRHHNVANEQMIFVDVVKELGSMQGILGSGQTALVFHVCPVRILEWMLSNTTNTRDYEKSVFLVVILLDPCQVCPRILVCGDYTVEFENDYMFEFATEVNEKTTNEIDDVLEENYDVREDDQWKGNQ